MQSKNVFSGLSTLKDDADQKRKENPNMPTWEIAKQVAKQKGNRNPEDYIDERKESFVIGLATPVEKQVRKLFFGLVMIKTLMTSANPFQLLPVEIWYKIFSGTRGPGPLTQDEAEKIMCDVDNKRLGKLSMSQFYELRQNLERKRRFCEVEFPTSSSTTTPTTTTSAL